MLESGDGIVLLGAFKGNEAMPHHLVLSMLVPITDNQKQNNSFCDPL